MTCHEFSRPVADTLEAGVGLAQMQPGRNECLTCHEMRVLVSDMPEDEPHDRVCGACHNPHDQRTPREAERTCASAGCHVQPDTLTPMHQGLAVGVLDNCLGCHSAHEFRVEGSRCLDCHADIFQDEPRPVGQPALRDPGAGTVAGLPPRLWSAVRARFVGGGASETVASGADALQQARPSVRQPAPRPVQARPPRAHDPLVFSHARHRNVECTACHSSERAHGAVTVTSVRDCRSCHHTAPVVNQCEACHQPAQLRAADYPVRQAVALSVAAAPRTRELPFSHHVHRGESCQTCHREPLTMRSTASCNDCHEQHHRPQSQCMSCHVQPPSDAHTVNAHLGCSGAGCHDPAPAQVRNVPRTRNLCLSCHQDLVQHEPTGNCADCHRLPAPRPQAARAAPGPMAGGVPR